MAVVQNGTRILAVSLPGHICAIPLSHVIETMRPLPVVRIASTLPFVRGMSIIRGIPTPVVDLGKLLGTPDGITRRFVMLRVGQKQVALSVNDVLGIAEMDIAATKNLPSLLRGACEDVIEAVSILDEQILLILRAGWQLPDEVWQALATQGASQ